MTGVIATIPKLRFTSGSGAPLAGGTLTVYAAGTTTPENTWQDRALTIPNQNPIPLDGFGACVVWLDSTKTYKIVLKDSSGALQWTQDNISGGGIDTSVELAAPAIQAATDAALASASAAAGSAATAAHIYSGTYASDPTTRPGGSAIQTGDEYFNSTSNLSKRFNGTTWVASDINTANLAASSGSTLVGHIASGSGAVAVTLQAKLREFISVAGFGAVGDGVTDDTAAIQNAITAAGTGGTVLFKGTHAISGTLQPLANQTWEGIGGACDLYFTATSANPGVEFTVTGSFATVRNIGFRATTGFTGAAFKFNASLNCRLEGAFIRNVLNGKSVMLSGAAFYNEARNIKTTACGTGLYVTGTSPNCPNNNVADNFDVYGASGVTTAMFSDSNCSMFTLRNFISEAECATNILKLTAGQFEFISPRFECTATPSGGFFDIASATVRFTGQQFRLQKATHSSLTSDLSELRSNKLHNLIPDPLFQSPFGTTPNDWTITFGTASSITRTANRPAVSPVGNVAEMVTSSAQTNLGYQLSTGAVQTLFRGKKVRVHALTWFTGPGTASTVLARFDGGTSVSGSQVSENLVANEWRIHTAELAVPSDATSITFVWSCVGNGGTFRLFSPVIEVEGSYYSLSHPTQERPWLANGLYVGDLGLHIGYASTAPTTGTWARGDRIYNRIPVVGNPKSWVCTVAGTPGTWVSEGNL